MTNLHSELTRYLSMRKGLGYKYQHQTRRLTDFVSFMETSNASSRWSGRHYRPIGMRPGHCG